LVSTIKLLKSGSASWKSEAGGRSNSSLSVSATAAGKSKGKDGVCSGVELL
jgi:hypothetical protein